MVYFSKSAECVFQTAKPRENVFHILFCIWMIKSGIYIWILKQHSMSTCRQNKHTQRQLVESENAVSNCEKYLICTIYTLAQSCSSVEPTLALICHCNYFQTSKDHMIWIINKVNRMPTHFGVACESVRLLARGHMIRGSTIYCISPLQPWHTRVLPWNNITKCVSRTNLGWGNGWEGRVGGVI